ncbi:ras-associated and pleckstrin homology domains-containing protein 1-like [Anopheles marshallii]|uniref:ras-associated and pleckstrin homology domains-containing protein 1-like n=1 Tax=Anopheles marshallii TaxID=1521116 RepID=UPI00237B6F4B|nr:ras-associated and pleckstrin homology domains-containing protein 1-like [Anopheles marshallii]
MVKYFVMMATVVAIAQALDSGEAGIDVKINVEKNSNSYLSGRLSQGSFVYGLNVDKQKDNHFQHKVKGPDDVTYGCYGFVDPDGKPHLVHYVSDLKGYRVVQPDSATKIYVARLESSINNVYQAPQEKNVQWKDLFFPPACKQALNETELDITSAPTTTTTTPRPFVPKERVTPTPSPPTPAPEEDTPPTTPRRPPVKPSPTPTTTTPSPSTPEEEIAPSTRRPSLPKYPLTPRPSKPLPPPNVITNDPEPKPSDMCSSVVQAPPTQPACSKVCDELKNELEDIKGKLNTLLDTLAEKPKSGADGSGTKFAYFPVMLSDGLPDGVDASSSKFVFPAAPQQCGNQ